MQEGTASIHNEQSSDRRRFLAQTSMVVRENRFEFELLGCEVVAGASSPFQCDFLVKNPTNNQKATIAIRENRKTYAIDSQGNSISASNVDMANSGKSFIDLPPNIPVKATVFFEGMPEDDVVLINLSCYSIGGDVLRYDVQFNFQSQ